MKAVLFAVALLLLPTLADASPARESSPRPEVLTGNFLHYHPDLKHRMRGMKHYSAGEHSDALSAFQQSARYADKASQAMVGEMLWAGEGAERDPVLAYVWMDLASERGYHTFVVLRERYWRALDEAQQARALTQGQAIYAEYGDAVAKPRLERLLRSGRREVTGSRTGHVGSLQIMIPGPGGWISVDGSTFYAEHYWSPKEYFAWQDDIWTAPLSGQVDVGPLQNLPSEPPVKDAQD